MDSYNEFSIESLETRQMMAGDVSAEVVNGNLMITGDNQNNELFVVATGGGTYELYAANGTAVNGQSATTLDGVTKNVRINMRGGDDRVAVMGLGGGITRNLVLNMGAGNDRVVLENTAVKKNVNVRTGAGDDLVHVSGGEIRDRLNVRTGGGDDRLAVKNATSIRGNVRMGTGSDQVLVDSTTALLRVNYNMGAGNDLLHTNNNSGDFRYAGGGGSDFYSGPFLPPPGFDGNGVTVDSFGYQLDIGSQMIESHLELVL